MRTEFSPEQLRDPATAASAAAIRRCVHCGFCLSACPTYALFGDELDSPRGRIYLIKEMLERGGNPGIETVRHIDRCLSCLACVSSCPSNVDYARLIDHARDHIEQHYRRAWHERLARRLLRSSLPHRRRLRILLRVAARLRPAARWLARRRAGGSLAAMLRLAPASVPTALAASDSRVPNRRGCVALLQGCVEPVISPQVRAATVRLLNRLGCDVVFIDGEGCCGALALHSGARADARALARHNVRLWARALGSHKLDALLVTSAGCGTAIKDYGQLLDDDPGLAGPARQMAALARDISEFLHEVGIPPGQAGGMPVAYSAACSLQHGQAVHAAPIDLLQRSGFKVLQPAEQQMCCGSAGTYNLLQPEIAAALRDRKVLELERLSPRAIATGNVGCMVQIASGTRLPVVHTVELLDWANGGPMPTALQPS